MAKKEKVTNKIEKEELENLQTLRATNSQNLNKLGLLELKLLKAEEEKWSIKEEIANIDQQYLEALKNLQEKYGRVEIDLETGEIKENEANKED